MAIVKEFRCREHGDFESSHPICPGMGCLSTHVERVILTPPHARIGNDYVGRHERGLRDTMDGMGIKNLRTAKGGESSYGGHRASELLWGGNIEKGTGMSMQQITAQTAQPWTARKPDGSTVTVPSGMRLAGQAGLTQEVLPPAAKIVSKHDRR